MRSRDYLEFATKVLSRQRGRAAILLLAVALSVASGLVMTALGEGARNYIRIEFSGLGKDLLVIMPGRKETRGGVPPITGSALRDVTLEDLEFLRQRVPQVRLVPLIIGSVEAKQSARLRQTMLLGTSNDLRYTHGLQLLQGNWFPRDEGNAPITLLGKTVAKELFGAKNPVGEWVRYDNHRYRVVGVFTSTSSNLGMDFSEAALIPTRSAMNLFNSEGLFRLIVQPLPNSLWGEGARGLIDELERLMTERHQTLDVTVVRRDAIMTTFNDILGKLTLAVGGIGAISLLVSGIMMMNLALISTKQRTGEIGLLKALGADNRLIRNLFLEEALLLSGVGATIGVLIGYLSVWGIRLIWPFFPAEVPLLATLLFFSGALATGVIFCWLPAKKASAADPVTSLRAGMW